MSQHYSEADLLETYYTQPGQSMPVMMHLAGCAECAARYERLDHKIRGLASCHTAERSDAFWAAQRAAILRRVDSAVSHSLFARVTRMAAAAVLALLLSGTLVWPLFNDDTPVNRTVTASEIAEPADPWESEELSDLQPIVEWESWVDNGGRS
jgi:anti-sigma factor RsiW